MSHHGNLSRPPRSRHVWILVGLLLGALPTLGAREVPNFSLLDARGKNYELYRTPGRAVVLFFTGTGCPIARKSTAKLKQLRQEFGKQGVEFWIVNSYAGDSLRDIGKEADELGLHSFPYLRDTRQAVALALGIQRTAEVVVVETERWKPIYQGAIDDQFTEGAERPAPQEHYLQQALQQFLAGQPITQARTSARGCRLSFAPAAEAANAPDYATQVAPILKANCLECHREGSIGPWAMDGYERVKNYARMMEEVVLTRRMPPYDPDPEHGKFANEHRLTREDTQTLLRWVASGAPRGTGPDPLTEPLPALVDWPLGKPDLLLKPPGTQTIPATGVLDYRHIPVGEPVDHDIWISAVDIRPGNRRVLHHAILYASWPGCPDDGSGNGVHVFGWAPGAVPATYPPGVGKRIPAGAKFNLELHYTTAGSEQTDETEVALYLHPEPQARDAETRNATQYDLDIPPGADEMRHVATYAFREPATIYGLAPHMHFRGKWMRYELLLPDGSREVLLNVPRYDFKWQLSYRLATPRHVPAGSWLLVTGAFDNSPANPANPDATKRVRFGLQSWDEMFIGFFDAANDPKPTGTTAGGQP